MPRYAAGLGGSQVAVAPTEEEAKLIRGMNHVGRIHYARGCVQLTGTNISALHFDGPDLDQMIAVHREIERIANENRPR